METALDKRPEDLTLFATQFFNSPDLRKRVKARELGLPEK